MLLSLIKVRDKNDAELEVIQVRAIEPCVIPENVVEDENNEEEIMENVNEEENEETRIMRLKCEQIFHTLTASIKESIEERVVDAADKRSSKSQDWQSTQNIGQTPRQQHLYNNR